SKNGASGAPDAAPGGGSVQPPAGGKGGSAGGEARGPIDPLKAQSYTWVLLLTIGGAAAAYFGIPRLVPDYQTYLPKLVVETPYAVKAGIAAAGGLIGVTLSQRGTWSGFVFKLFGGAASAAITTFRGWARFGLLFNAGVTGGSPKEAENAPISAAFWRYPILAWPAVLTGYGFGPLFLAAGFLALGFSPLSWTFLALSLVAGGAPVAFVAGFLYKAVSTPVMALARGVKQLVVGFFPWLGDVLEAAREILANIVPFTVGFVTGGFKAWWNATAAGSAVFARPFYDLLIQKARPETLPGWIGIAVAKVLTAVAMIPAALLGGLLGTLASVLYSPTRALSDGMRATESQIRFAKVMVAWFDGLELERGIDAWIAGGANGRPETIDARSGLIAFAHVFAQTAYQIPAAAAYGLAAYFRAWGRARYFLQNGKFPERAPQAAAPAADAPAAAAVPSKPAAGYGFFPDLAIAGAGAWLGYSALGFFGGPAGWLALALAAAGGAFAALSFTQPSTWRDWLSSTRRAARDSALESFRSWAGLGLGSAAALVDGPVDLALKKASPAWIGRYPALAWPAVLIGYPLAAAAFVAGGVFQFALVPFKAAWLGLESLARETGRFFKKALPFAVGFIGGALMGWGAAIVGGATILGKPLFEQVVTPSEKYDESSWIGFIGSWAVRIAAAVAGVAAGALGAAAGLVLGLPVVLSTALHRGNRAAGNEGRFARALRIWAYETFNAEFLPLEKLAEPGFPEQGKPISAWDGLLRLGNTAGAAAMAVLALPLVVLAAHLRSSRDAWRYAGARDAKVSIIELVDGLNDRLNAMPGSTKAYGPYNYTGARASESLSDKHDLPLFFEERGRTGYIRLAFNTEADLAAARQAGIVEDVIGGYPVEVVVLESATPADEAAPAAKEAAPAPAPPAQPSVRYVAGLGLLGLALGIVGVIGTLPFLGPLGFWTAAGFYAAAGS
ncbi:MAG TPA: hypothetical protein VNI01_05375, partial [Elusimicrobiota bacterium]|nr:hypothetical protein [Elusimicrobiota bacterium]